MPHAKQKIVRDGRRPVEAWEREPECTAEEAWSAEFDPVGANALELEPYLLGELDAVIGDLSLRPGVDAASVMDQIVTAAQSYHSSLKFHHPPLYAPPRISQKLDRAASAGRLADLKDGDPLRDYVFIGAMREKFVDSYDDVGWQQLIDDPDKMKRARAAAKKAWQKFNSGGRPTDEDTPEFVQALAKIYTDATGQPAALSRRPLSNDGEGKPSGLFLRFVKACVLPIVDPPPSDEALAHLIRSIG